MENWVATTTATKAPPPQFVAQVTKNHGVLHHSQSDDARQAKNNLESALKILNLQMQKVINKQITAKGRVGRALAKHMNQLEMFHNCLNAISAELHTECPHTSSAAIVAVSRISSQIHRELHTTRDLGIDDHHENTHELDSHGIIQNESMEAHISALPIMKSIRSHSVRVSNALAETESAYEETKRVSAEILDFSLAVKMAMAAPSARAETIKETEKVIAKKLEEELKLSLADTPAEIRKRAFEGALEARLASIHAMALEMGTRGHSFVVETYNTHILPKITHWHDHLHALRNNCVASMMTRFGKSKEAMDVLSKPEALEASVETLATELRSAMKTIADGSVDAANMNLLQVDKIANLTSLISKSVEFSLADNMGILAKESENLKLLEKTIRDAATGKPSALHAVKTLLGDEEFSKVLAQVDSIHNGLSAEEQATFITSWIADAIDTVHAATQEFNKAMGINPSGNGPDNAFRA